MSADFAIIRDGGECDHCGRLSADRAVPQPFTEEAVSAALNSACDDVLDAIDAEDEGTRDALNLLVNVAMQYLTGQSDNVQQAIDNTYDEDPAEVLEWIAS